MKPRALGGEVEATSGVVEWDDGSRVERSEVS